MSKKKFIRVLASAFLLTTPLGNAFRDPPQRLPTPVNLLHRVVNHRFYGTGPTRTMPPESFNLRRSVTSRVY